ncbi:MAG: imidazole glycerol phosphate synthase subunit HisH [Mariprofundaceae bacterium]|nr:imidazole glycerol phosphate synthase subunit HisH [Mariprofundaceae bacterium]
MIALIDYGMGNLHSVTKAIERAGGRIRLVKTPEQLKDCDRIVLPGVGAFRDCIGALHQSGLDEAIKERCAAGTPFLGICLGMQVLLSRSFEFGEYKGLDMIPGDVICFPRTLPAKGLKIPHMGWNDVLLPEQAHPVLEALGNQQCYFVHSYYCVPDDETHTLAQCGYGDIRFACAIGRDNIISVQFHPEKSQAAGLALLESFLQWNP